MDILANLKQQAEQLSWHQRASFIQFLEEQQRLDAQTQQAQSTQTNGALADTGTDRLRESQWLVSHWQDYVGQFVCLEGDQLISAGHDHFQVYAQARAAGIQAPFMLRVQDPHLEYLDGFTEVL